MKTPRHPPMANALDKLPPHSAEAEAGVLGCIIHSPLECLEHCAATNVQPDAFYDLRHRTIYQGMVRLCMAAKAIDLITIQQHLKDRNELQDAGGIAYLSTLPALVPGANNIGYYIPILLEKQVARQAIALCTQTVAEAYEKTPENWLVDFREQVIQLRIGVQTTARPIGELVRPPKDDPTELLQHRFLCEKGSLLFNGPTGAGKSSFLMQALALWSNALPFFGIIPTKALTAVLIQAENDDGDLAEMRDGMCAGLKFSVEQRQNFFTRVLVFTSNGTVGRRFCNEVVHPLLCAHKPNLICIDPANSFHGGDVKEQKDVGAFLRTWLNPLLFAHHCACILNHHTNKPPSGKEKAPWKNGEFAYAGAGSAEWANWARAVLTLQDSGKHGFYHLHAAKRGVRLHWRDSESSDEPAYQKLIAHSNDGLIYWRQADPSELDSTSPKGEQAKALLEFLRPASLTASQWFDLAHADTNISRATFFRYVDYLQTQNLASKFEHKWRIHNPPETRRETAKSQVSPPRTPPMH